MKIGVIGAVMAAATIGYAPVAHAITAEEAWRTTYNWPIPMPTVDGLVNGVHRDRLDYLVLH